MSTERCFNFSAGPATLPAEVIDEITRKLPHFGGASILEISHRGERVQAILEEARALVTELMGLPKGYSVLFLQGGATQQFAMVPMNLLEGGADYAITGAWSQKALAEAALFGEARVAFTSEGSHFSRVPLPEEVSVAEGSSYLHITSNNTIFGTQYALFPETGTVPLVADMSSDILSRMIEPSRFGLVYAGAQKNLGPAGVTLVVIRDDLLERAPRSVPNILRYRTHAEAGSCSNTPPVFAIWATLLTLRWLKGQGGVPAIEARNRKKAAMLYDAIDRSSLYRGNAEAESRSMMNVTFTLPSEDVAKRFLDGAAEAGMMGLKGHRSVDGVRASIYNAMPVEGVAKLVEYMKAFEKNG